MAGTLFGLGLSQQFDVNGDPMSGCLLYIYAANTSTPSVVYKNVALTPGQEHTWPIVGDSTGRIPAFWLADGSYRARLTDAGGSPQFDEPNMLALGPSSGAGPGADTTDPNSVASTGDVKWRPINNTLAGWVRINGQTLGSATSGSDNAALANQALFEFIWNNFTDAICPVVSGRGGSAAADWAANKRITLLDMRGRSPFGFDDMGNVAAGAFTDVTFAAGNATTPGGKGGTATKVLTVPNLPNVVLPTTIAAGQGSHTHNSSVGSAFKVPGGAGGGNFGGGADQQATIANATLPAMAGTTPTGGTDTPVQTISPFLLGTWYWRL